MNFYQELELQKLILMQKQNNYEKKTKGENVEFNTVSVEGKVMALKENINGIEAGKWKKIKTFNNLDDAKEYLDGLLTPVE